MASEKRLIDANAFRQSLEVDRFGCTDIVKVNIALDKSTVDAVEVVHGRWERVIPTKSAAKWSTKVSCSVCHRQGYTHHKYCPYCGAKMDGERKDNERKAD